VIEAVNIRVATHIEKYSLTASCLLHAMSSKIKIEFGHVSLSETTVVGERKVAGSLIDVKKFLKY